MANLGGTFDPNEVPERDNNFDCLPAGTYDAQITDSVVVPTKDQRGRILKLTWEVIAGQLANRKFFQNLNIQNPSPKAQEIAQRDLADICEATGAGTISDSQDLHYKPCSVRIAIEKQKGYDDKNVVKRVKPIGGTVTPMRTYPGYAASQAPQPDTARQTRNGGSTASQPAQEPQRAAAGGGRPWGNKR